jgi:hypothetical protein
MAVPGSQGVVGGMKARYYIHPQGSVIRVDSLGFVTKHNAQGKVVGSSATADKLARGHGQWIEMSEPNYIRHLAAAQTGKVKGYPQKPKPRFVPEVKPHWQPGQGQGLQRKRVS